MVTMTGVNNSMGDSVEQTSLALERCVVSSECDRVSAAYGEGHSSCTNTGESQTFNQRGDQTAPFMKS